MKDNLHLPKSFLLIIFTLLVCCLEPISAEIETLRAESEKYSVSFEAEVDGRYVSTAPKIVPMTVLDKEKNREDRFSLKLPKGIACRRVTKEGFPLSPVIYKDRLMVTTGTHCSETLIVNLRTGETVDTIWGMSGTSSFSKSGRFLAYIEHIPRRAVVKPYREVLLVYDLERSPVENRLDPQYESDPRASGIPVFPEENAHAKNYDFMLEGWERESFIFSPVLWLEDETIFLVEWRHPEVNYVIRIDLKKGLRRSEITRRKIVPCISDDITGPIHVESSSRLKNTLQIVDLEEKEDTLFLRILPDIVDRLEGVKGDVIRISLDVFDKPPCQSETN